MEEIMKINTYKRFLISKNNIIIEVNRNFLELTGYIESEILGLTLVEASKLFRIDSQVNLEDIEGDTKMFLFTKLLIAIEGTISCKTIDSGDQKVFLFKIDPFSLANERFNLVNEFGTSRGDGVAILSFSNLVLVNSNQYFLDFLVPPFNKRLTSMGKSIMEISTGYIEFQFNNIKDFVIKTRIPYHVEEICVNSGMLGESYWNITVVPILDKGVIKYFILTLTNKTEEVLNRKAIEQKNQEFEAIIDNMNDETIIFDKDLNIIHVSKEIEEHYIKDNIPLKNINDIVKYAKNFDEDNQLITYGNLPLQRVARGEFISNYIMITENSSGPVYKEVSGTR